MELEATKSAPAIRGISVVSGSSRLQTKSQDFVWLVLVGVCVSAVYLVLLPYVARTWRTTGDEPHYLLTAHSLVHDGDFDLKNNYDQLDYLAFYFSKDITRQIRYDSTGGEILDHYLGLPVLIAPAYALGGRFGVLAFQAMLAGLLAAITFKLAWSVSEDMGAALLGTLFVFFSPPLLLYPYLVYPELIAALLVTISLFFIVATRPTGLGVVALVVSLIVLPWLNRRFVPLTLMLAMLACWPYWSGRLIPISRIILFKNLKVGLIAVGLTVLSIGSLWWVNSHFSAPARVDISVPATGALLWTRLARGVGWLVDQQRGLFIWAPVYIMAVWSLPVLGRDFWRSRNWLLLVPFILSLGLTTAAGGFWIAWELGPRYLVVALPALAPLLALAWRAYRRSKLFVGLTILLYAISVINGVVILRQPELPYKSSLPIVYSNLFHLPLTDWLPNLGDYETIAPNLANDAADQVIQQNGESLWSASGGQSTPLITATPLNALSFGHYRLRWPIQAAPGLPPETELLRLSIKHLGGGQVFYKTITAADLPADGSFGLVEESFVNPDPDRWRTAMVLQATATGQSDLRAKAVRITPDPLYAWVLPYFYLAFIVASAVWLWYRSGRGRSTLPSEPAWPTAVPAPYFWSAALVIPVAAIGYLGWQHYLGSYTYDVTAFQHFVGQPIVDEAALDHRAWLVDPAVDPPQKAIYGPFDIYDAGRYQVTFRLKLPQPVDTIDPVARLQVAATANLDELLTQLLTAQAFSQPNHYQNFTLTIDNPRRQALSFEVYYLGLAPLAVDQVTVTKINS
ncbi:MAG: hypothetical protein KDI62_00695 [Anaerolineae bacterium]|nr:hypothetical protein [Anaerolineae bacterium]MCB9105204.1 hypothetical protein [Anaerolineales bacterium]